MPLRGSLSKRGRTKEGPVRLPLDLLGFLAGGHSIERPCPPVITPPAQPQGKKIKLRVQPGQCPACRVTLNKNRQCYNRMCKSFVGVKS